MISFNTASLRPARKKKTISLTALIDVVFILLLFFMLTTSFTKDSAIDIEIPTPIASAEQQQWPQLLVLHNDNSVGFFAASEQAQELKRKKLIHAVADINTALPVIVLPHAEVTLQTITSTLETLQQHSIKAVLGKTLEAQP